MKHFNFSNAFPNLPVSLRKPFFQIDYMYIHPCYYFRQISTLFSFFVIARVNPKNQTNLITEIIIIISKKGKCSWRFLKLLKMIMKLSIKRRYLQIGPPMISVEFVTISDARWDIFLFSSLTSILNCAVWKKRKKQQLLFSFFSSPSSRDKEVPFAAMQ